MQDSVADRASDTAAGSAPSAAGQGSSGRKAVGAAVVGNVLEWYDFSAYGYLATVIAKRFFPSGDDTTALLATFAAFGVGFVVRPLGGVVVGRLGDTRGRKAALVLTIFLMACFVGYYVVWGVTPALHSPLMGLTNAISSVIVVGAILATGLSDSIAAKVFGFLAVTLASVNIFGGFMVTRRMLAMFRKKG